ncbi:MAG: hypothetical protein K8S98_02595 [Planctomycetes bacterium]|nr:hypothetical protein [Planctomycetota bacterium]
MRPRPSAFLRLALALSLSTSPALAQDFGFEAFPDGAGTGQPGSSIAVGPSHVVGAVNNEIRFFLKDGTPTYQNTFSGSLGFFPGAGTVFDSQALFDPHTQRFVVAGAYTIGFQDFLNVAISDDADPNGVWRQQTVQIDSLNGVALFSWDRPTLGVDAQAIYVAIDFFFGSSSSTFSHGFVLNFDKAALIAGAPLPPTAVEPFQDPISLGAARTYDANAPAEYFVSPFGEPLGSNRMMLIALTNPLGTPTVTRFDLTVPAFGFVDPAVDVIPQLGTPTPATITDSRTKRSVYRNGSLWTAHHVHNPATSRVVVRWYEVRMNGWPASGQSPVLVQSGEIDPGATVHTFFPDVAVDSQGNAGFVYNRGSSSELISVARAFRLAADPLGTVQGLQSMHTSTSLGLFGTWGLYGSADVDESMPGRFWGSGTFRRPNQFGGVNPATWFGAFGGACNAGAANYCISNPNSTGQAARISTGGSLSIADNSFTLTASSCIPNGFGLFFYGKTQTQVPFGAGVRCIGNPVVRINPPNHADALGTATRSIDLSAPPFDGGPGAIHAGETWNFQYWYRDVADPLGFNLTDGASATFCQ